VFWTLQVEFLWYILFPLCLTLWIKAPKLFLPAALLPHPIGIALHHYAPTVANYMSFWMMLLPFMLGIVAADAFLRKPAWIAWALPAFIVTIAFALLFQWRPVFGWTHTQMSWHFASFFLVVAGGSVPALLRALSTKPFVAVGIASYSIYLVHSLAVHAWVFHRHGILLGFVAVASGVALGFAFWFVFERPVTERPLRDRLWAAVGKVVQPSLSWWKLPSFGELPVPAKV
jgi:peptidoglycan/LPS O-acetylase OafA/YrhL